MKPTKNRALARPNPEDWGQNELMTLPEAVGVFWPSGPLSVSTLRTAIRAGRLEVSVVARRHLTTPAAIARMSQCGVLKT
jgi:hypothetical protein